MESRDRAMSEQLTPPTLEDLALLWEAIECVEDERGGDFSEVKAAHARVLNYLYENGVFRRQEVA